MILSMTGFAAVAAELAGVSLAVELRSVNHRYLDLAVRLPDELRTLEPALRERLARELEARQGRVPRRASAAATRAPCRSPSTRPASQQLAAAAADVARLLPDSTPPLDLRGHPALAGRAGRAVRSPPTCWPSAW